MTVSQIVGYFANMSTQLAPLATSGDNRFFTSREKLDSVAKSLVKGHMLMAVDLDSSAVQYNQGTANMQHQLLVMILEKSVDTPDTNNRLYFHTTIAEQIIWRMIQDSQSGLIRGFDFNSISIDLGKAGDNFTGVMISIPVLQFVEERAEIWL